MSLFKITAKDTIPKGTDLTNNPYELTSEGFINNITDVRKIIDGLGLTDELSDSQTLVELTTKDDIINR